MFFWGASCTSLFLVELFLVPPISPGVWPEHVVATLVNVGAKALESRGVVAEAVTLDADDPRFVERYPQFDLQRRATSRWYVAKRSLGQYYLSAYFVSFGDSEPRFYFQQTSALLGGFESMQMAVQ